MSSRAEEHFDIIGNYYHIKERCGNRFVKEKELIEAILQELEWLTMDQDRFEKEVLKVLVYPDHIEVEKN